MKEEIIYVVDEKDKFVRKATRQEVREKALLHRTSRVIIKNNKDKLLIQKRSKTKDVNPGLWDVGIAETVIEGGSYEGTAMRGLLEELGITGISNIQLMHSLLFKIRFSSPNHNVFLKVYLLKYNGKIEIQTEEIDQVKFVTFDEIKNLIENKSFSPARKLVFKKYLEWQNKAQKND